MKHCLSALAEIDRALQNTKRILIATDFDGTLCPIASSPSDVEVSPAILDILQSAASNPRVVVAVISGRALADVRSRVPLDLVFAGNHGLEISGQGLSFEHEGARQLRPVIHSACHALCTAMRDWPGAWIEDKGLSATLHFRSVDERQHYCLISAARQRLASFGPQIAFRVGKRALEVRPRVEWDKGFALRYIEEQLGPFDACIAMGDDRTDEMMFRANSGHLNIRIGSARPTAAAYCLCDSSEVAAFLSHVTDMCHPAVESQAMAYATM